MATESETVTGLVQVETKPGAAWTPEIISPVGHRLPGSTRDEPREELPGDSELLDDFDE